MRFNVRLEISNPPGETRPYALITHSGRTGRIGRLTYLYTTGGCGAGICGVDFFDAGGNLILSAPFQTIQQSGTMRVHTLVGDDGTFLTTPGVSLPYSPLDLTNDKLEIIPFGMTAGNVAPFSTNNGAFNTFVSGSSAVFKCGN